MLTKPLCILVAATFWLACGEPVSPVVNPAGIRVLKGDGQIRFPNSRLLVNPSVEVVDESGRRAVDADLRVDWEVIAGGGVVQPFETFTGGGGTTSTIWILGSGLGAQRLRATVEGFDPVEIAAQASPIGPILFASTRDVANNPETLNDDIAADLFVMEPDGSNPVRLTKQTGSVNWLKQPAWVPNSPEVVFVRDFLVNPTNPVTQTLTPNGIHFLHLLNDIERRAPPTTNNGFFLSMTEPALDAGGTNLATVNGQIWLLTSSGTNVRSVTNDQNRSPTWSPDGSRVAFSCATGICTQVAQQNQTRQAITTKPNDREPNWSADGTEILFTRAGAERGIWVVDPVGKAERQIIFGEYSSPSGSPDGQELVAVLTHASGLRDIVLIDMSNGLATNLTDGAGDNFHPAWRR